MDIAETWFIGALPYRRCFISLVSIRWADVSLEAIWIFLYLLFCKLKQGNRLETPYPQLHSNIIKFTWTVKWFYGDITPFTTALIFTTAIILDAAECFSIITPPPHVASKIRKVIETSPNPLSFMTWKMRYDASQRGRSVSQHFLIRRRHD